MSATPPDATPPSAAPPGASLPEAAPDLGNADDTLGAVGAASLRLMAGAVPKRTMDQLRRSVQASTTEFPWQIVTQAILAEPVETQRLVQQGLQAQRDWILRGGRETPGPSLANRTKGLLARLAAQLIFGAIYAVVIIGLLLLLKFKFPGCDIYRVLAWVQSFGFGH